MRGYDDGLNRFEACVEREVFWTAVAGSRSDDSIPRMTYSFSMTILSCIYRKLQKSFA